MARYHIVNALADTVPFCNLLERVTPCVFGCTSGSVTPIRRTQYSGELRVGAVLPSDGPTY